MPVDLTTDVVLDGEGVDATLYEDIGDTGTVDDQETVAVEDGTNTYTLSSLEGGGGNAYYLRFDLTSSSAGSTPTINSATATVPTPEESTTSVSASSTTTIVSSTTASATTATVTSATSGGGSVASTTTVSATTASVAESPLSATTTLPDEDAPVLGNGVEDEVAVDRESETTNYGDVRVQIRETAASDWDASATGFAEQTLAFDTLTTQFTDREDGEEYEVRARSETEHRTGAWTAPVDIVTLFPGSADLSATAAGPSSVDLSWTDNSDNEDGQLILREEHVGGDWGPAVEVGDAGVDAESFTDDAALPDRDYRYRMRSYTDDTSADSNEATATTPETDEPSGEVPPDGWYVRVLADGTAVEPSVSGEAAWVPKLNSLPEAVVPVENADRFERSLYDDAEVQAWKDGVRLPIDEISEVDVGPGGSGELTLRGGTQLKRLVDVEYENESVSDAARGIVSSTTDYDDNVDDAQSTGSGGVEQQGVDSATDWVNALADSVPDDAIYRVDDDGNLRACQTFYPVNTNDADTYRSNPLSGGEDEPWVAEDIDRFDETEFNSQPAGVTATVDLDHEIPGDEVEFAVRLSFSDEDPDDEGAALHHGYEVRVDGETVASEDADSRQYLNDDWENVTYDGDGSFPDVPAGETTIELLFTGPLSSKSDAETRVDTIGLGDARVLAGLPAYPNDSVNSDNEWIVERCYPDAVEVETDDVSTVQQITGAELDADFNNTDEQQEVALSNDGGSTFELTASNSESVSGDFSETSNTVRARFTIGGYEGDSIDFVTGTDSGQAVDAYQLFTNLDNTPTLINRSFRGDARDVLTEIADFGGFVWEVRRDGGTYSVEFTQPGTRDGSVPASVETDFEVDRETDEIILAAEVTGGASPRNGERFEADTSEDPIELSRSRIVDGTEQVYDPDTGEVFDYGDDYTTNNGAGEVVVLSSGSMSDGTQYRIDYQFKPFGEYESGAYDGDTERKVVETFPSVTSQIAAESAALRLVSNGSTPLVTATLSLSGVGPGLSLVESLHPKNEAFRDRTFEVWESDSKPGEVTLRLGQGETIEDTLSFVENQLSQVEERA